VAKQPTRAEVIVRGFDYAGLEARVAKEVLSAAGRIRAGVKRTLESIIEVGDDLLAVKGKLPHGQFGKWLKAEFGWGERTAENFMSVAGRFGPKAEMIADLSIAPTAAYLLAAPSAPDAARAQAVERAEAGEEITAAVAREILAEARKKGPPAKPGRAAARVLVPKLLAALERFRQRWKAGELAELAGQLRRFADGLDARQKQRAAGKPKKA
jgi:hypothetical protein